VERKRTYTVPVLLILLTLLAILIVLVYSKLLLLQQEQSKEEGKRLSERYNYALIFADRLKNGSDALLKDGSMTERLKAKEQLGEATMAAGETMGILTEAVHRDSGQSYEEAFKPLSEAMTKMMSEQSGHVYGVAEHEGPLTQEEKDMLLIVRDGAAKMEEELLKFRPPSVDAGFRSMAAGQDWVGPALAAGKALEETAAKLK